MSVYDNALHILRNMTCIYHDMTRSEVPIYCQIEIVEVLRECYEL